MKTRALAARSLRYFWRTNLAVAIGVGVAVSALAGALVVGDSVRSSLRDLAVSRLGRTDLIVTATALFTETLARRIEAAPELQSTWTGAVPVLALEGVVVEQRSGRRAGSVQVFGVDNRFWMFHGVKGVSGPDGRSAFLSAALARELGVTAGDALLLRIQKPSAIPAGVLQGKRDEPGRAVRLNTARVLSRDELGDFSPRPQQRDARTLFVSLGRLQRDVDLPGRIDMMLFGASPTAPADASGLTRLVERMVDLSDLGLRVRPVGGPSLAVESASGYLTDAMVRGASDAAREVGVEAIPVLTYLATAIKANGRETPYSLVSALPAFALGAPASAFVGLPPDMELGASARATASRPEPPIWLSQWTADDLGAHTGDAVTLEYFLWSDAEGLAASSSSFVMAGVLPMTGLAIDGDLTPEYPGVSSSANISDWDPPFPVDLHRIRKKDEEYWHQYRAAPKAFVRIEDGQALWRSRYGQVTSLRIPAGTWPMTELRAAIDRTLPKHVPAALGEFRATAVRSDATTAAAGTTDFGEYFTYFSFFVVVASLLLTMLFFRLGIEQRASEIGLLGALGYTPRAVAGILLAEGSVLAVVGAAIGVAGALGYSALIMLALRTLWIGAVGTTELRVHASAMPLATGALGGVIAAIACLLWSLRVLWRSSARQLMSGGWLDTDNVSAASSRRVRLTAIAAVIVALALVAVAAAGWLPAAAGFFGSGTLLLIAGLCGLALWLRGTSTRAFTVGAWPLLRFGVRNARYRPARSVLSAALIAAATFLIVSVGAFRQGSQDVTDRHSAAGGYALIGETIAPLMHDPATKAGRDALNLPSSLEGIQVARFRLRPGDDASCLNLYRPTSPRLLGATKEFVDANHFSFASSLAGSDAEKQNPWLLLNRQFEERVVPVIGDATSLTYVFHLAVGDDFVMNGPDGLPLRLRIVGALRDSVLQSELVMADAPFTRLFPRNEGFRVFLISAEPSRVEGVAAALEDQLQDFGMDVQASSERLEAFHRVENTYLSTFQALGGLGLVLGTLGLGTVLLRNVLERRRELALLRVTGYRRTDLVVTVIAESVFLLGCGLILGVVCAFIAIAPAYADRGQGLPVAGTLGLLVAVFVSGLLSTVLATRAVATAELLPALKNE